MGSWSYLSLTVVPFPVSKQLCVFRALRVGLVSVSEFRSYCVSDELP